VILNRVIVISDNNSDIVERYEYTVFGKGTVHTDDGDDDIWMTEDDTTASASAKDNPYMFTGRRYDEESGLYYYRARYYAYDIGRFLNPDQSATSAV